MKWPADVASTLNAAFGKNQGLEDQHALNGAPLFVPAVVGALTAKGPAAMGAPEGDAGHYIMSSGQANASITRDVTGTLDCLHEDPIVAAPACFSADDYKTGSSEQTDVARGLTTTAADRTGGAPIVAFTQNQRDEVRAVAGALAAEPGMKQQTYIAFEPRYYTRDNKTGGAPSDTVQLNATGAAKAGDAAPCIAFSSKDHGADAGEIAPTLRSMNHSGSHANGGGQIAIAIQGAATRENPASGPDGVGVRADDAAYTIEARAEVQAVAFESRFVRNGRGSPSDVVPPLKAQSGETGKGDAAPLVAFHNRQDPDVSGDVTHPLGAKDNGLGLGLGLAVRRLTPRECERLQGFPDDYTLIQVRGKPAKDGPRYRALGNSMAVPVMRWIGQRIDDVVATAGA